MQEIPEIDLQMLRAFNEISEEFLNRDKISLDTVSNLIVSIRLYRYELSKKQLRVLLQIPLNILQNDVELKDPTGYTIHGDYFSGNMVLRGDDFMDVLKKKFSSSMFSLEDVTTLTKYIRDNIENIKGEIEYMLRIPEVTIRDDVHLISSSNFGRSGRVFSKIIDNAMGL